MNEEELKRLAAQLSCPHGEKATVVADDMAENNANMIWQTILQLDLQAGDQVLEIGHGGADHLQKTFALQPEITYHGLDLSILMHERAESLHHGKSRVHFHHYDGENFPVFPCRFSHIFSVNTLYFWQKPREFLQKLAQLLTPDGKIVLAYGKKSFMESLPFTRFGFTLYEEQELEALAASAGLKTLSHLEQKEQVISRIGQPVERHFVITTLQLLGEK